MRVLSRLEGAEDGLEPTSVLVASDLCEEGGPAEAGALCPQANLIYVTQESEELQANQERRTTADPDAASGQCSSSPN